MAKRRIRSVEQLDREIYRYKLRVKEVEHEFDRSIDHVKHHFPSMVLRSVLGRLRPSKPTGVAGDVVLRLLESEQMQNGLFSLIDKLSARIGKVFRKGRKGEAESGETEPTVPDA